MISSLRSSSYIEDNADRSTQLRNPSFGRIRLFDIRLDILLIVFLGLNLLGTFVAFSKSSIQPTERRLQSTLTVDESIFSNTIYNDQDDRKDSLRRLQKLIMGTPADGVEIPSPEIDNQTSTTASDHHFHIDHPKLPRWSQDIVSTYGSKPVILGLESCRVYRARVLRQRRRLMAPAGMFHTGTSLLVTLLEDHCHFDSDHGLTERTTHQGLHGQVPWGKHNPASFRDLGFSAIQYWVENREIPRAAVLPIVTVAHPYHWMNNMCRQPVTANWNVPPASRRRRRDLGQPQNSSTPEDGFKPCPYVVRGKYHHPVSVTVQYGNDMKVQYESMAHLWNKWNRDYYDSRAYPRLMIRYEDLLFHPVQVVKEVCSCVGGDYYHLDEQQQVTDFFNGTDPAGSAAEMDNINIAEAKRLMMSDPKNTAFHYTAAQNVEETGDMTSLEEAWIRYGKTPSLNNSAIDQWFIQRILDKDMMRAFGYKI